jgi:hypothetical protein
VEDLTGFDVDPDQIEGGDAGGNFSKLRGSRDQWKTRALAAEAAARRGMLIEAGFHPETAEGKALLRSLDAGEIQADPASITAFAAEEYGWSPSVMIYGPREARVIEDGIRAARLSQETQSNGRAGSVEAEYQSAIADARETGNFNEASRLQLEYERKMRPSRRG